MGTQATLVMPYYDNPLMLREQFLSIRRLPDKIKELLRIIIVDDGSPSAPATAEKDETGGVPLEIYRIKNDIRWNQHGARNVGMHHTTTAWNVLTDMDHMVPEATWEKLVLRDRKVGRKFYMFNRVSAPDMSPYKWHPNSYFLTKELFDAAGGYDERFAGFYGTDSDLRHRLEKFGHRVDLTEVLIRVPREVVPDASTTRYQRKAPEDAGALKRVRAWRAQNPGWRPLRLQQPYERVL
jgi:glycosyltransferase involved in cell wall biosynthesis